MTNTVLLTGISGFVGGHTALALLNAGYRVRGSVRSLKKVDAVRETLAGAGADTGNVEFVELDLMSDKGWDEAIEGCRYLVHVASPYVIEMPKDPDELIRPAVEGTERAIAAALRAKVERIVLTSSMIAVMVGHERTRTSPFTERDWSILDKSGAYGRSKILAERRAWEMMEEAGRRNDLVVCNPGNIMGPLLDDDPGTSGELIAHFLDGSYPGVPRFAFPVVDVRDLAHIQTAALTAKDAGGHRIPMGPESPSFPEVAIAFRERFPERASRIPRFTVPDGLVRILAIFNSALRANQSELGVTRVADATSARRLLSRDFIPGMQSYVSMAQSLIERGMV